MGKVNEERVARNNPETISVTGIYDRDTRQRRRAQQRADAKKKA